MSALRLQIRHMRWPYPAVTSYRGCPCSNALLPSPDLASAGLVPVCGSMVTSKCGCDALIALAVRSQFGQNVGSSRLVRSSFSAVIATATTAGILGPFRYLKASPASFRFVSSDLLRETFRDASEGVLNIEIKEQRQIGAKHRCDGQRASAIEVIKTSTRGILLYFQRRV